MEHERTFTTHRIAGIAIETVTDARAALNYDDVQKVRAMISEAEDNINAFANGHVPPGNDRLYAVIDNLIVREALPHGTPQHDTETILAQLRNAGINVPDLNIQKTLREHGVLPFSAQALDKELGTEPTQAPTSQQAETIKQTTDTDITIYTTPNCMGCKATQRQFDKMGLAYIVIDLSERPDLITAFKAQGLTQAPIVQTATDIWTGMRPDKIKQIGRDYKNSNRTTDTGTSHER